MNMFLYQILNDNYLEKVFKFVGHSVITCKVKKKGLDYGFCQFVDGKEGKFVIPNKTIVIREIGLVETKEEKYLEIADKEVRIFSDNGSIVVSANYGVYEVALRNEDNIFIEVINDDSHAHLTINFKVCKEIMNFMEAVKYALGK